MHPHRSSMNSSEDPRTVRRKIPKGVPLSEVQHFESLPIGQPTLDDPNFRIHYLSRTITHSGRGHTLMGGTWNTNDTIAHLLSLYRKPLQSSSPTTSTDQSTSDPATRAEVRRFYTLGPMLNAHPDLLHGGVIACILDSTMGNAIGLSLPRNDNTFTAQLNTRYEKPVRTPGTVMARAWVKRVEDGGRKVWVEGVVEGLEEGAMPVRHASAEGLWVRAKGRRKEENQRDGQGKGKL